MILSIMVAISISESTICMVTSCYIKIKILRYIHEYSGRYIKFSSMGCNPLFALLRIRASLASVKASCTARI